MAAKESDGIDSYNQSVWASLGHVAFEDDYVMALDDTLEWWDKGDE